MFLAPSQKLRFLRSTSVAERLQDLLQCFDQLIAELTDRNDRHNSVDDDGDDQEEDEEEAGSDLEDAAQPGAFANPLYDSEEDDEDHEEPPDANATPGMDEEEDHLPEGPPGSPLE